MYLRRRQLHRRLHQPLHHVFLVPPRGGEHSRDEEVLPLRLRLIHLVLRLHRRGGRKIVVAQELVHSAPPLLDLQVRPGPGQGLWLVHPFAAQANKRRVVRQRQRRGGQIPHVVPRARWVLCPVLPPAPGHFLPTRSYGGRACCASPGPAASSRGRDCVAGRHSGTLLHLRMSVELVRRPQRAPPRPLRPFPARCAP